LMIMARIQWVLARQSTRGTRKVWVDNIPIQIHRDQNIFIAKDAFSFWPFVHSSQSLLRDS
jgi:hypothetical protein